jgi:hypothetical protein
MPSFSQILAQSVTDAGVQATVVYATAADLPLSGNTAGDIAFVGETNRMYIFNGNGWYNIALINTNPTITTGPDGSYSFALDGTPIVITLEAEDPEGLPITWAYSVTSGSLGSTATVSQTDNVFTLTPSTLEAEAGEFSITFTASDGINLATAASSFTLSFAPDWTTATLLHSITNPNTYGDTAADAFGISCGVSGNYAVVGARSAADATGSASGMLYVFNVTTGALLHSIANPNAAGTTANDVFAWASAISGNYAIAGATDEDRADGAGSNTGKAYIFDVTTGALVYTLDNPNAYGDEAADNFGAAVSIFGNHAIVSAIGEDEEHGT